MARPHGEAWSYGASVLERLARGFDHRLNNIATVLTIAAQQVGEGDAPEAADQLRSVLTRSVEQLGLLQEVLGNESPSTDLNRAARAVASVVSGFDHRLIVTTDLAPVEVAIDVPTPVVVRLLMTAALIVHACAPRGGHLSFVVSPTPSASLFQIVGSSSDGPLAAPQALPGRAQHDLDDMREVAASIGHQVSCVSNGAELVLGVTRAAAQPC